MGFALIVFLKKTIFVIIQISEGGGEVYLLKGEAKMKRLLPLFTLVLLLSFALTAGVYANSMKSNSMIPKGIKTYGTNDLIGQTVKSRDGEALGRIFDLIVDNNGHVDFAIVNQFSSEDFEGRAIIVPFSTLAISKTKSMKFNVVFNQDKEKFWEGPDWGDTNLSNPKEAAMTDRFYGIEPYWTEGGGMER